MHTKSLFFLFLLSSLATPAFGCGNTPEEPFRFIYYPKQGSSVTASGKTVKIDTSFLDRLIAKPSRKAYDENSQELFYLLLTGNAKAQHAGARVLAYLIANPKLEEPCGGGKKADVYGIEELAFVFSRTDLQSLCLVTARERDLVVRYYKRNKRLAVGPDRPWSATCK